MTAPRHKGGVGDWVGICAQEWSVGGDLYAEVAESAEDAEKRERLGWGMTKIVGRIGFTESLKILLCPTGQSRAPGKGGIA